MGDRAFMFLIRDRAVDAVLVPRLVQDLRKYTMSQRSSMFIEAIVLDVSDLRRAMTFWTSITGRKFGPSYEANFRRASFDSGPDLGFTGSSGN